MVGAFLREKEEKRSLSFRRRSLRGGKGEYKKTSTRKRGEVTEGRGENKMRGKYDEGGKIRGKNSTRGNKTRGE